MRAVIIDDESKCRRKLHLMLNEYCSDVEVVGEADCVKSGVEAICELDPDLVLLDVNLPDGTGFDLIERVMPYHFQLIIISATDKHALLAFKNDALDYIVKPISSELLCHAIAKASRNISLLVISRAEKRSDRSRHRVSLKMLTERLYVNLKDVVYCKSDGNYTTFVLNTGETHMCSQTLREYEDRFVDNNFFRIHKSCLINLCYVVKYINEGRVVLSTGEELSVSRNHKKSLLERMEVL